jgi:hypothetical protein
MAFRVDLTKKHNYQRSALYKSTFLPSRYPIHSQGNLAQGPALRIHKTMNRYYGL